MINYLPHKELIVFEKGIPEETSSWENHLTFQACLCGLVVFLVCSWLFCFFFLMTGAITFPVQLPTLCFIHSSLSVVPSGVQRAGMRGCSGSLGRRSHAGPSPLSWFLVGNSHCLGSSLLLAFSPVCSLLAVPLEVSFLLQAEILPRSLWGSFCELCFLSAINY